MTAAKRLPLALEDIAAATLRGDVRDFLMQWGKNLPKAWPQMSQREQEAFRDACDRQAEALVRRVTNLVGAQGFESFEISVGDFQKKGNKLEAKIGAPYSRDTLIDLAEAGEAGPIVLSLVSMREFQGERAPAKVMPDQPDLMGEAGADDGADVGVAADCEDIEATTETSTDTSDTITEASADLGDELAAGHQQDALADTDGGSVISPADAASAEANAEALSGIKKLDFGDEDRIDATPSDAPKKRRGRRSAEERVAANTAATEKSSENRAH